MLVKQKVDNFLKKLPNTFVSVKFQIWHFLKFWVSYHHFYTDDIIKLYVNMSNQIILHINNWKYRCNYSGHEVICNLKYSLVHAN